MSQGQALPPLSPCITFIWLQEETGSKQSNCWRLSGKEVLCLASNPDAPTQLAPSRSDSFGEDGSGSHFGQDMLQLMCWGWSELSLGTPPPPPMPWGEREDRQGEVGKKTTADKARPRGCWEEERKGLRLLGAGGGCGGKITQSGAAGSGGVGSAPPPGYRQIRQPKTAKRQWVSSAHWWGR